ncbi:baseplate J/gp47 family protein [Nostoc sp. FACHB-152]|uniref:baseplate J/gp47 family protein n=1 Tax=Nostoc sp. FACHB-152 TaxID=2692837 RepID=UPI0016858F54|nr:baseplate J/gp47 family protein [Nostoc sp. FACHB-152]MBD2452241.1 baseplate J/gp47 family protein [Nostoc sp. FACHB-152]
MDEELNQTIPLQSILIDPRNEETLVAEAQVVVSNASNGQLNDFSENSPVAALIQGQAFAGAELLYYINQLPLALVVDFLKVTGVQRSLGTKAKATLTFNISSPQSVDFTIPQGFEVVDDSGNYSFFTDALLTIPTGLVSGSVTATAEETGSNYNLPAYTLTGITQPLTFLAGVTNIEPANGGTDEENQTQTIERALSRLRLRNLVSASDYEDAAEEILGDKSRCKAIGLLSSGRDKEELGAVHLFLLNTNQQPANSAQLLQVRQSLYQSIQLGSSLYCSPMEIQNVSGELVARLATGADPETVVNDLWEAFQGYLNPSTYPLDQDVILNEVEYVLRSTEGIRDIQSLILNGQASNIALPNKWTLPAAYSFYIRLATDNGGSYDALRGAGEPEEFGGI